MANDKNAYHMLTMLRVAAYTIVEERNFLTLRRAAQCSSISADCGLHKDIYLHPSFSLAIILQNVSAVYTATVSVAPSPLVLAAIQIDEDNYYQHSIDTSNYGIYQLVYTLSVKINAHRSAVCHILAAC